MACRGMLHRLEQELANAENPAVSEPTQKRVERLRKLVELFEAHARTGR